MSDANPASTDGRDNSTPDSLSRHRSVWEMRADGWIGLVDDLGRIATLAREHEDFEPCLARVRSIVAALAPIESYWAFPGGRVFGKLASWIERGELARAHQAARRIHRMLAAQTYRHESAAIDAEGDLPSQIETDSERRSPSASIAADSWR